MCGWLAPKPPWLVSKVTAGRLEALKKAIVGLVMTVEEVEGSFKLNQHKSDVDFATIAAELGRQPEAGAKAIADEMRRLRPLLFEGQSAQAGTKVVPEGTA